MSSDFAVNLVSKVFEGAESKNNIKILVRTFFGQKNLGFLGVKPPKSDRKLKLSDFDEIWYPGVFEGADFKNRLIFTWNHFLGSESWFLGSPVLLPKSCEIES